MTLLIILENDEQKEPKLDRQQEIMTFRAEINQVEIKQNQKDHRKQKLVQKPSEARTSSSSFYIYWLVTLDGDHLLWEIALAGQFGAYVLFCFTLIVWFHPLTSDPTRYKILYVKYCIVYLNYLYILLITYTLKI